MPLSSGIEQGTGNKQSTKNWTQYGHYGHVKAFSFHSDLAVNLSYFDHCHMLLVFQTTIGYGKDNFLSSEFSSWIFPENVACILSTYDRKLSMSVEEEIQTRSSFDAEPSERWRAWFLQTLHRWLHSVIELQLCPHYHLFITIIQSLCEIITVYKLCT